MNKVFVKDIIPLLDVEVTIEFWRVSGTNLVYEDTFAGRYLDMELYGDREVLHLEIKGTRRVSIHLREV